MTSISPLTITIRGKALVRRALKEKMLRTKRFASENIQDEETQEGDDFEYISLPKKENLYELGRSEGKECPKIVANEDKAPSQAKLLNYYNGNPVPSSSRRGETLNLDDFGLPVTFSGRRKRGEKPTFECNLCNITLTSFEHKKQHENGKRHLKKQNDLEVQVVTIVAVSSPPRTRLEKVYQSLRQFCISPTMIVQGANPVAPADQGDSRACCGFGVHPGEERFRHCQ